MEFEIDDGRDEIVEVTPEEYCRQLIEFWNGDYTIRHRIYN